jgi:O-antigen/teichoic acid export membrane protein
MEQVDLQEIKHKTTSSVIFLSLRNIGIQAISFVGFFLLTYILGTKEVGVFAIVAESVGILGYFSDIGLAAALIQQKTEVTKDELQTTFTVQQILVLLALVIAIPIIKNQNLASNELWIVVSLCFSFIAASLKTIPSVLLERKLNFKLLSTIDIVENITFYIFAVLFAFLGFGTLSYAIATFIRSLLGLLIIYKFISWPIGFSFSKDVAKKLFKYGIPYQFNSFISVAKDRLSNLFVAQIIGTNSFGILAWAQKGPRMPLSFMDAIMKITFPTFSRLQEHKDLLKKSLDKSLFFIALVVFPALVGISFVGQDFIYIVPKYTKWLPAIFPMYLYSLNYAIAAITTPITNAFNAVGKITLTTRFMIMWTILTWIFFPILSWKFGYIGTVWASVIVGLSSFIVWIVAKKEFDVNIFQSVQKPFLGSVLMGLILFCINQLNLNHFLNIIFKVISGSLIYLIFIYLSSKTEINWFWQQIKCLKNKKQS